MSATIKDVAKLAGVSVSTASLAMNNKPRVSEKTRIKVHRAAKILGYHPNVIARGLVSGRTETLGLIIPHTASYVFSFPYFAEVVRGIGNTANNFGYRLILSTTSTETAQESAYIRMVKEGFIDGLILLDIRLRDERITELRRLNFPFILIGRDPWSEGISYVDSDNINGTSKATQHLINLGHKRIIFINGPSDYAVSFDRLEGYRRALEEAGLSYSSNLVKNSDFRQESGYRTIKELLAASYDFTALLAASDLMAMGAIKAIKERGLKVPEDIAVIGFDDIPAAGFADPPLTTVRQPIYQIGSLAAEILIRTLQKERVKKNQIVMPTELVIRKSCGFDSTH
jgi:DNA-binding LacI/PurR family transcriptional regulator